MLDEINKILNCSTSKFYQAGFIIYADLESLIKKMPWCKDNVEKTSTAKVVEHTACDYSISMVCWFDDGKNKHDINTWSKIAWKSSVNA